MNHGGIVVEVVGHINDASMPVCGYAGPNAAIVGMLVVIIILFLIIIFFIIIIIELLGVHHYLYSFDWHNGYQFKMDPDKLAEEVYNFYKFTNNNKNHKRHHLINK